VAPSRAFKAIGRRPTWVVPIVLSIIIGVAFAVVYLAKADPVEVTRARFDMSPRTAQMDPAQREQAIAMQASFIKPAAWIFSVAGPPLWFAILGLYFMLAFRFFYGGTLSFLQAFSVAAFVNLATELVQTPLLLLTFVLKGDWNIPPEIVLQASPAMFLDSTQTAPWLMSLASSLDIFTIWRLALYAIAFGVITKRSTGSASWAGIVPWIVLSLLGAGFRALMG
jgi:hypothetical protein